MSFFKVLISICFMASLFLGGLYATARPHSIINEMSVDSNLKPTQQLCSEQVFNLHERKYNVEAELHSAPLELADGNLVFSSNQSLYFLSPNGTMITQYDLGGRVLKTPAILSDGTIVVGAMNDIVYFLTFDGESVEPRGQYQAEDAVYASPVVLSDDTIVVGSMYGAVEFLSFEGEGAILKARYETWGSILALTKIANDMVVATSADSKLYVIRFNFADNSSHLIDSYYIKDLSFVSPVILSDRTIIAHSWKGLIYALRFDSNRELQSVGELDLERSIYARARVLSDDTVVIGSNKRVYFLSLQADGQIERRAIKKIRGVVESDFAVMSDDTVVVGSSRGIIYFLDSSGNLKTKFKQKRSRFGPPIILQNGLVMVTSIQRVKAGQWQRKRIHFLELYCGE